MNGKKSDPVNDEQWDEMKKSYWDTVKECYNKINAHYDARREQMTANLEAKKLWLPK